MDAELKLSDGPYLVLGIQHYLECIIKKHEALTDNPPLQAYINRTENQVTFKIETRYYCNASTHAVMKLLGSIEIKIKKDKNGENVPQLERS